MLVLTIYAGKSDNLRWTRRARRLVAKAQKHGPENHQWFSCGLAGPPVVPVFIRVTRLATGQQGHGTNRNCNFQTMLTCANLFQLALTQQRVVWPGLTPRCQAAPKQHKPAAKRPRRLAAVTGPGARVDLSLCHRRALVTTALLPGACPVPARFLVLLALVLLLALLFGPGVSRRFPPRATADRALCSGNRLCKQLWLM